MIVWALGGAVLGLVIGSFIATLVIRWPQGLALGGRSRCDHCGQVLGMRDLVPVVSYALARGRCRQCDGAIDWRHPGVEVAAAFIGFASFLAVPGPSGLAGAVFGWQLLALAMLDVDGFWLPDRLTASLAISGAAVILLENNGYDKVIGGVASYVSLAGISLAYRAVRGREGLGGGDPKLFGGIGLWLGWQVLPFVLFAASAIGLIAVFIARVRGRQVAATDRVPFGTLLALAAFPAWLVLNA